ncbi:MAG: ABC transporter permease [Acidobacteriota bacterium]
MNRRDGHDDRDRQRPDGADETRRGPGRSLRVTRHAPDVARDVTDEVEFHLEMRAAELVEQGMEPADAQRAARQAFGDRARIEDRTRAISGPAVQREHRAEWIASLLRDVRQALRGLLKEPTFALTAILTLGLCIGANVAVFTVVNDVVLRPLPFPDADRLVTFYNGYPGSGIERTNNSVPDYFDRQNLEALAGVALYDQVSATIGEGAASANVFISHVSPPFFDVLGVAPVMGRTFDADDGVVGQNHNIVVSHAFWQSYLGGADDVLGRTVEIEDSTFTVIGVMPEDFEFVTWNAQVWFSFAWPEQMRTAYHRNNYRMIGRLKPGATVQQAQQQLDALNAEVAAGYPPEARQSLAAAGFHSVVLSWQDDLVRDFRAPLYLLLASVALVLVIGAFNIANLLLLRASGRLRELSTRFVLGASRWRIARQLFTESLVVTLLGGAIGIVLSAWSQRYLSLFEHYQVPRLAEVRLDATAIAFALAVSCAVATLAAVLPVLMVRRGDLYGVFRGATSTPGQRGAAWSMREALVAGQVASAFVLVTVGGLLLSSLMNLWRVDPGFDVAGLSGGGVLLTADRYPTAADRAAFRERALRELKAIPGVSGAAFATQLPFSGEESRIVFFPEGYEYAADEAVEAHFYTGITDGYFDTLSIPLLAGRAFGPGDDLQAPKVVIVDEALAQRYWPGDSPLGRRIAFNSRPSEDEEWLTVVGVVGSVVQNDLDETAPRGAFYLPATQQGEVMWRWVVRSEADPATVSEQAQAIFRGLDPEMASFWSFTMRGAIAERLIPRRIPMLLVMGFAAVALLLTTLGVYGVLAYAAARRTREFGIRLALGSSVSDIYRLMARSAVAVVVAGIALGAAGALLLGRLVASQLYDVQPADPKVIAAAVAVVAAVAFLAYLVPTRRATRVDPMVTLREE